jgi:hypothetical protein
MVKPPEKDDSGIKGERLPYSNLLGDGRRSKWVCVEVKEIKEMDEPKDTG